MINGSHVLVKQPSNVRSPLWNNIQNLKVILHIGVVAFFIEYRYFFRLCASLAGDGQLFSLKKTISVSILAGSHERKTHCTPLTSRVLSKNDDGSYGKTKLQGRQG